jgi:Transposase IS116/IS110/IS902 family
VISPRQVRSLRARYGTAGNKTTGWTPWCSPMRYGPTPAAGSRCNRTRRPRSRCGCWSGLAAAWSPTASPSTTSCWPSCNSTSLVRSDCSRGSISRSAWRSYAGSRPSRRGLAHPSPHGRLAPGQRLLRPAHPGQLLDHLRQAAQARPAAPAAAVSRLLVGTLVELLTSSAFRPAHWRPGCTRPCWPIPTGRSLLPAPGRHHPRRNPAGRARGLPRPLPDPTALAAAAGVAPSTRQSGKFLRVADRRGCNQHLRAALVDWAQDTPRANPWAHDTYQRARARGCRHPHAARILANAWTRVSGAAGTTRHLRSRPAPPPHPPHQPDHLT